MKEAEERQRALMEAQKLAAEDLAKDQQVVAVDTDTAARRQELEALEATLAERRAEESRLSAELAELEARRKDQLSRQIALEEAILDQGGEITLSGYRVYSPNYRRHAALELRSE